MQSMARETMSALEAVVLGCVQGLTEFLPISSTAHLRVVPSLLGWADPGAAFSAVIQLGSVLAVLAYFARDLVAISGGCFRALAAKDYIHQDVRLVSAILLGTLPVCLAGLALKSTLEQTNGPLRSLIVIGCASIFMGIVLWVAEQVGRRSRAVADMGAGDGLLIGLGQAMALIPGCSRSGSTLTAALFLNMKRDDAARFSFLLGIPAILLSGLLELKHLAGGGIAQEALSSLLLGLSTSFVVSYLAIGWLLTFLKSHSTVVFTGYRLIFGLTVIGLTLSGHIH